MHFCALGGMFCGSVLFLLLIIGCATIVNASASACWGADPVSQSKYPDIDFVTQFPTETTVTVGFGESLDDAQALCDDIVGNNGYCVIELSANPLVPIYLYRSRSKLISRSGVVIKSQSLGSESIISVTTPTIQQIVISGLDIQGHKATEVNGIFISGNGIRNIVVENNEIHDFEGTDGAHAIAVYGGGADVMQDIMIRDNNVYDMKTGWSESIVVNGFVQRWAIRGNYVGNVNNIAIDAIGGEGTFEPSSEGRVLPDANDAARDGFIEENYVENMSTATNAKYGNKETWAAGIYIDGAFNIVVRGNTVKNAPWAFEIGAENCVITRHISMTGNTASGSYYGDLLLGGYAKGGFVENSSIQCNPKASADKDEGHGNVQNVLVRYNSFESAGNTVEGTARITVQNRLTCAAVIEAQAVAINDDGDGGAEGDDNAVCTTASTCGL